VRQALIISLIIFLAVCAMAQTASKPQVQVGPAPYTPADSGKAMFDAYCASCHGTDAKGHGPAASAMAMPVPDLTTLAKSHGGKYPAFTVGETLRVTKPLAAHGSNTMPIWGPIFSQVSRQDQAVIQQRIHNLNTYIESLQQK
jgi:mono/diheme cytochrome c family protein